MARLLPFERRPRQRSGPTGDAEDARLVQRLSSGDDTALTSIMDRYGGPLLAFAYRMVGDKHLAEEIFQDTMVKVWQQAGALRMDGHLRAWLFRVARNNAIDYMRKKRPILEELGPGLPATGNRPEQEAELSWLCGQLGSAMAELPLTYREVIDLRYFHQMGYHEISTILGIPVGTVKSRISYALNRLTKILRARGIDASLVEN